MTDVNIKKYLENFIEKTNFDDASFYLREIYEQSIFDCFDASFLTIEKIHQKLIEQKHTSPESALKIDFDLFVYAPETNISTTDCFVFANSKGNLFNTILNGPRNVEKDIKLLKAININTDNYIDRGWKGVEKLSVYQLSPNKDKHLSKYERNMTLQETLDSFFEDSYSNSICCKINKSTDGPYKNYGFKTISTFDFIKSYFSAFYLTIQKLDLNEYHLQETKKYQEIDYKRSHGVPVYDAIEKLTTYLLRESNYKLDKNMFEKINYIEKYVIEGKFALYIPVLQKIYQICKKDDYTSKEKEFDHNDLDNSVYIDPQYKDKMVFYSKNQNREYTAILSFDKEMKPETFLLYTDIKTKKCIEDSDEFFNILKEGKSYALIGDIVINEGKPLLRNDLYLNMEEIKAWNSYLLDIETAMICLEEDI